MDKIEGMFLRTVLKKDVHDRLQKFAQKYMTGRGDWDFGVAVEILLDWYDSSQLSSINDKLDLLINGINKEQYIPEEQEEFEELLGGHKEK